MIEQLLVGATGLSYFIVGVLQLSKGAIGNAVMWIGYALAQIGLYMNLK
jgi:hypothetical protein